MSNEELVLRYQSAHDLEEQKELLTELHNQNSGLIASIARRYEAYCELDDLMQEGYLGMVSAVERWDATKGANFATYAHYWIVQALSRYTKENGSVLRVPEYQLTMIQKYENLVSDYFLKTSKTPPDRYLMLYLGISKQQLERLKKDIEALKIKSLDAPVVSEDMNITLGESIADDSDQYQAVEDKMQNEQLADVLWTIVDTSLSDVESTILKEKYQNNRSAEEMADMLGISKDKVYNHTNKAIRELRRHKNRKRLEPFYEESRIFSLSIGCSSYGYFKNYGCSAPERVVLLMEENKERLALVGK